MGWWSMSSWPRPTHVQARGSRYAELEAVLAMLERSSLPRT